MLSGWLSTSASSERAISSMLAPPRRSSTRKICPAPIGPPLVDATYTAPSWNQIPSPRTITAAPSAWHFERTVSPVGTGSGTSIHSIARSSPTAMFVVA